MNVKFSVQPGVPVATLSLAVKLVDLMAFQGRSRSP